MRFSEKEYEAFLSSKRQSKNEGGVTAKFPGANAGKFGLPFPDDAWSFRDSPHSKALLSLLKRPAQYYGNQEHFHQCYIFHYFEVYHPDIYQFLYATPNAGARGKVERGRLLSAGLKAGFPDISLDMPVGQYHGLRCELKRPDARATTSEKQHHWIELLNSQGYMAFIAFGYQEAIPEIKSYCGVE